MIFTFFFHNQNPQQFNLEIWYFSTEDSDISVTPLQTNSVFVSGGMQAPHVIKCISLTYFIFIFNGYNLWLSLSIDQAVCLPQRISFSFNISRISPKYFSLQANNMFALGRMQPPHVLNWSVLSKTKLTFTFNWILYDWGPLRAFDFHV